MGQIMFGADQFQMLPLKISGNDNRIQAILDI